MNDPTILDCFLYGALVGAGILAVCGLCWAVAYQGRKRWSAERRAFHERAVKVGHGGS